MSIDALLLHLEEDARSPRLLQTVRGVGYRLVEE